MKNPAKEIISTSPIHPIYSEYREVAHYWMLQLLIPMGGVNDLVRDDCCLDDDVLHELGLSNLLEAEVFKIADAKQALKKMYQKLGISSPSIPTNTQLARNIHWLGNVSGLNQVEQSILHFRVIASRHLILRNCIKSLGNGIDLLYASHLLARLLNVNESDVEQALKPDSRLVCTGLISVSAKLESLLEKLVKSQLCQLLQ